MIEIQLSQAIALSEGEEKITTLKLDMDKLTGWDAIRAEKEARKGNPAMTVPVLSTVYQVHMAAKAADLPADVIYGLKAVDFTTLTMEVQNFLLGQVSAGAMLKDYGASQ